VGFSKISKSLINIRGNFILMKFGKILRLIKLGRLLRYKVDISRKFRLIGLSGFPRF